jgi:hypothetical protein
MKIKLNQPILNFNGKPFVQDEKILYPKDNEKKKFIVVQKPLLLRDLIINSLLAPKQGDDAKAKLLKGRLAEEVYNAENEIDLPTEKVIVIKAMIDFFYQTPFVVYDAYRLIEGEVTRDEIKDANNIVDVNNPA